MTHLLDNIVWHTLSAAHHHLSVGAADARRYSPGFSPIIGFADVENPNFAALEVHCEPGEQLYTDGWAGPAPAGWNIDAESTMFKMVWDAPVPAEDEAPDAVPLGPAHASQAVDLARMTNPGPFGLRTLELGDYFGYFEEGRLIAMAGERFHAAPWREVSGVCTHSDYRGRGLARRLMMRLIHRQVRRGETPFLHVMRDNATARDLYRRMDFVEYRETVVRVVSRL